jgi:hypothetical protein
MTTVIGKFASPPGFVGIKFQVEPESMLLYILFIVIEEPLMGFVLTAYTVPGCNGSGVRNFTPTVEPLLKVGSPALAVDQVAPPFRLRKAPKSVPTYRVEGVDGSISKVSYAGRNGVIPVPEGSHVDPPSVLLNTMYEELVRAYIV